MDVAGIIYIIVASVTIAMNAVIAIADFAGAQFVTANSAELGVPTSWAPVLGTLKVAGVVGLLVGLLWLPALAIAAATGLVLFYGTVIPEGTGCVNRVAGLWFCWLSASG